MPARVIEIALQWALKIYLEGFGVPDSGLQQILGIPAKGALALLHPPCIPCNNQDTHFRATLFIEDTASQTEEILVSSPGCTFGQLRREIIIEAPTLPEPAVDVAFRNLGRLLDKDARVQELHIMIAFILGLYAACQSATRHLACHLRIYCVGDTPHKLRM